MTLAERAPRREAPRNPEFEGFTDGLVGLQARLLAVSTTDADRELIRPNNTNVAEITPDMLATLGTLDLTLVGNASLKERTQYWAKERANIALDARYTTWSNETKIAFNDETFFSSTEGKRWAMLFQRFGIQKCVDFDENDAQTLYKKYFSSENKKENVTRFVKEVLDAHTQTINGEKRIDVQAFEQNRNAIQWLTNIFGEKSAQVMTQISDGLTKPPEALAAAANESTPEGIARRNDLKTQPKEYELAAFVYTAQENTTATSTSPVTTTVTPTPQIDERTTPHEPPHILATNGTTEITPPTERTPTQDWEALRTHFRFTNENMWQNAGQIREIFQKSSVKDLPIYYLGSRNDISYPLAFTDATDFVFTDYDYVDTEGNINLGACPDLEITDLGGTILSTETEGDLGKGGKRILKFSWGGKERTITMYAEDATKYMPKELHQGASFVIIKAPTPVGRAEEPAPEWMTIPENYGPILSKVAVGGFIHQEPTKILPSEVIGFKKRLDAPDADDQHYRSNGYPLYEKTRTEPYITPLLLLDHNVLVARSIRNGDYTLGIDDISIQGYKDHVLGIRTNYLAFSENLQQALLPVLRKEIALETVSNEETTKLLKYLSKEELPTYLATIRAQTFEVFPELKRETTTIIPTVEASIDLHTWDEIVQKLALDSTIAAGIPDAEREQVLPLLQELLHTETLGINAIDPIRLGEYIKHLHILKDHYQALPEQIRKEILPILKEILAAETLSEERQTRMKNAMIDENKTSVQWLYDRMTTRAKTIIKDLQPQSPLPQPGKETSHIPIPPITNGHGTKPPPSPSPAAATINDEVSHVVQEPKETMPPEAFAALIAEIKKYGDIRYESIDASMDPAVIPFLEKLFHLMPKTHITQKMLAERREAISSSPDDMNILNLLTNKLAVLITYPTTSTPLRIAFERKLPKKARSEEQITVQTNLSDTGDIEGGTITILLGARNQLKETNIVFDATGTITSLQGEGFDTVSSIQLDHIFDIITDPSRENEIVNFVSLITA